MDCHCHIDVAGVLKSPHDFYQAITSDPRLNVKGFFNLMSTNHLDLQFLEDVLEIDKHKFIVPYFGIHPWYAHLFSCEESATKFDHYNRVLSNLTDELLHSLPEPISVALHLEKIRGLAHQCEQEGRPYGIGEIGLDKVFRVPCNGYYGNPFCRADDVSLTSAKTHMDHQVLILKRNLHLAEEFKKPVSLHCVKAHGPFFDVLSTSFLGISRLVFHSYTGSVDQAKRWLTVTHKQNRKLFFSFSNVINGVPEKEAGCRNLIDILGSDQLLIESDLPIDRYFLNNTQGEYFDSLQSIKLKIASLKSWGKKEADGILQNNFLVLHEIRH